MIKLDEYRNVIFTIEFWGEGQALLLVTDIIGIPIRRYVDMNLAQLEACAVIDAIIYDLQKKLSFAQNYGS